MATFVSFAFDVLKIPKRFAGTMGRMFWGGIALVYDALAEGVTYAQAASLIQHAPDDALPIIGWERGIVQGISESNDSYRDRLQNAWTAWPEGGTSTGILSQLDPYFGGSGVVVASRDPEGGSLAFPWSWFYVYYDAGEHPVTELDFGVETTARSIVRKWKDASEVCRAISLVLSGRIYGMTDGYTYGDADSDGLTYGDSEALLITG